MARFDTATGRYIFLTIDNVEYRVYFEENGSGIPVLMQHTAGLKGGGKLSISLYNRMEAVGLASALRGVGRVQYQ